MAAVFLLAACLGWALLAQTLVTPACDLPTPPANAGPLPCNVSTPTPSSD